jgi:hypothetical protein
MGKYTQRKWFDALELALLQSEGLRDLRYTNPNVNVSVTVQEEGQGAWLYLTQEGDLVDEDALILPGYEKVGMTDGELQAKLAYIHRRLQTISEQEAAAVWIRGLAASGIHEPERDKLIEATERLLDEATPPCMRNPRDHDRS